jgi:hypothetical protein
MDPDGPWTKEMVETMLGQALVVETKWKMAAHEAVFSGIGAAFKKEVGSGYLTSLQRVLDEARGGSGPRAEQSGPSDAAIRSLRDDLKALRGGRK